MADERTAGVEEVLREFRLDVPLVVTLAHDGLAEAQMFRLSFLIDGMELRRDPARPELKIKESLVFDVMEMETNQTVVRVTPR